MRASLLDFFHVARNSLFGIAIVAMSTAASANLITNGSFESGLTGWDCTAPEGGCFTGTQSGVSAYDGAVYFFGFDNVPPPGVLSQEFATVAGASYSVSLHFNTNGAVPPNALSLVVGDLNEALNLTQLSWEGFAGSFTASGATTTLELLFTTVGGTGTVFVDQVIVERAIPEPGTLALLGLGIAGLAASRRRKQ